MPNFTLELPALIEFIKRSCHENLHEILPHLRDLINDVMVHENDFFTRKHGEITKKFIRKIQRHLAHEETDLYQKIAKDRKIFIEDILPLISDHQAIQLDLHELRGVTANYVTLESYPMKLTTLLLELAEVDRILINHILIQDQILFPMLLDMSWSDLERHFHEKDL